MQLCRRFRFRALLLLNAHKIGCFPPYMIQLNEGTDSSAIGLPLFYVLSGISKQSGGSKTFIGLFLHVELIGLFIIAQPSRCHYQPFCISVKAGDQEQQLVIRLNIQGATDDGPLLQDSDCLFPFCITVSRQRPEIIPSGGPRNGIQTV